MASSIPSLQPPQTLFASIDMGTNSFKLLIIRAYPNGKFFTIDRLKENVTLGRDSSSSSSISTQSQSRALESLVTFKKMIQSHNIHQDHTRIVATAAVRDAVNKEEFVKSVKEKIGLQVDVLTGEEEAKFVYLGVLQFLPVYDKLVLSVDIGGGSTEFVIGKQGKIVFSESLKLGHVNLSERFVNSSFEVLEMREYIRVAIKESGLVEKVKECGFQVAVGSSGTTRAIEKAVFNGYYQDFVDHVGVFGECKRDWRICRGELKSVVERLCCEGEGEKVRRQRFFKRRSEFIVAGAVLLDEIFELLGIEDMEVSGYGLGEGVIAESLAKGFDGYDLNANARWRSVVRLAMRFNGKKRIKSAAQCASIAKDIFEGLRKCDELDSNQVKLMTSLDDKDLEYLEAACLLHNIGLFTVKKGYHKQSYHIILNGGHLYGYSTEEIKLIALLTRYHRKKFPKFDHAPLNEFPKEVKHKFRILCAITRLSVKLEQNGCVNLQEVVFSHSHEGFKLVIKEVRDPAFWTGVANPTVEDIEAELREELEYFKFVFKKEFLVMAPSSGPNNNSKDKISCKIGSNDNSKVQVSSETGSNDNSKDEISSETVSNDNSKDQGSNETASNDNPKDEISSETVSNDNPKDEISSETVSNDNSKDQISSETVSDDSSKDQILSETGANDNAKDQVSSETGSNDNLEDEVPNETGSNDNSKDEISRETSPNDNSKDQNSSETGSNDNSKDQTSNEAGSNENSKDHVSSETDVDQK